MVKEGLYYAMSNENYHSDNGYYSSSALKMLLTNPELFYHMYIKKENKKESNKDHFDLGTAIHSKILEPEKFSSQISFYTGIKRGKAWEDFKSNNEGKIVLGDLAEVKLNRMEESILKSEGKNFVTGGKSEVSLFTKIKGRKVKVRADHFKFGEFISDLKSMSGVITELSFMQQCDRYKYALSAALYFDAFNAISFDGEMPFQNFRDFYFVVTSTDFDDTKTFRCTPEFLEEGRKQYLEAFSLLDKYELNNWDFHKGIIDLKPLKQGELYEF